MHLETTVIRSSAVAEKQLYKFAALVALVLICSTSCTSQESALISGCYEGPCKCPVGLLAITMDGGGYVLDMDANNFSMDCALQQWHKGQLKVIGYARKAFSEMELQCCTTWREFATVIFRLKGHWRSLCEVPMECQYTHNFILVINSNYGPIFHHFGVRAT